MQSGQMPAYMGGANGNGAGNANSGGFNPGMWAGMMGLGGGLGQLFAGYNNPSDAASPYYNQMEQQLPGYFQPYINAGQQAMPQLQQQYSNLLNNPNGIMSQIGAGYHQSPGYQWQLGQGMNAANNAAAAGGMLGSPQHQQQAATMSEGLANQDYYNYMGHALGLYGSGLQGMQGMYNNGMNSSRALGEDMSQGLMSQANLAYSGQANQNQNQGGTWGSILGGAGSLIGAFL